MSDHLTDRRRSGQAMVICLIVIGFLVALVGATSTVLIVHSRRAHYEHNRVAAFYLAWSGLQKGRLHLERDDPRVDALSDGWATASTPIEKLSTGIFGLGRDLPESDSPAAAIIDEERKLNVNLADAGMLEALAQALTPEIVDRIVARRNRRPFASLAELTAVAGVTGELLAGPARKNGSSVGDLLTVHGTGKINVNTAPLTVLRCVPGLSPEEAADLVAMRDGEDGQSGTGDDSPFGSVEEVRRAVEKSADAWQEIRGWLTVRSTCFTIHGWGRATDEPVASVGARAVVVRSLAGRTRVIEFRETDP